MSRQIDTDTLRAWLDAQNAVVVLDVRSGDARAEGSIPGSVHVDADDDLRNGRAGSLSTIALPTDRPIVTVCNAGRLSQAAADVLQDRGLNAWSLSGGMKAWSLAWNAAELSLPNSHTHVVQLRRTGKGCLSYVVGAGDEAAVIDPSLPTEVYLDTLRQHGWTPKYVLETHVHADHLSRGRLLAKQTGAALFLPEQQRVRFPFTPLHDGDRLSVGDTSILARHTPGHTDESMTYLVGSAAFTGDTLFVRGVGRPDLHADAHAARHKARALFASLQQLRSLGPETLVLPGHTSDPVPFDRKPVVSTLGALEVWIADWLESEDAFVERLLARLPPTPPNFATIVDMNEAGELPAGDPTDLEAGANRCAVA